MNFASEPESSSSETLSTTPETTNPSKLPNTDETNTGEHAEAYEAEAARVIQGLSDELDRRCQERFDMGERKYGPGTWMQVDTLEMLIEELIDMLNYLRFTYIRIRAMQEMLGTDKSTEHPLEGMEMLGKDAFVSYRRA